MRWRSAASLGLVSLSLLAAAAPADAATAELGAVGLVAAGDDPTYVPPYTFTQFAVQSADGPLPAGNNSYAVPAGYGVITEWSHSSGGVAGDLLLTVWRKPDAEYRAVANVTRKITANTVQRFSTRIPVRPGDRLGLGSEAGNIPVAFAGYNPNSKLALLTDHPVNGPQGGGEPKNGYLLSVSARVETDADGDGFGDDTQDLCPSRADLQTACPAGPGGGGGGGGKDSEKPKVGKPRFSATTFRAAASGGAIGAGGKTVPVGTRVTFTASEAGSVKFRVQRRAAGRKVGKKCKAPSRKNRRKRSCIRYPALRGSFTVQATPGVNTFAFRGRIGGRKLKPGRYRLAGSAKDRAGNSAPVPAKAFRIVR
jgi:hypothetical protein